MNKLKTLVNGIKAVSDPSRIRILTMLAIKPLCVCEIAATLQLSQPTVSRHLKQLKDREYIIEEKEGKWVNYSLNKDIPKDSFVGKTLNAILMEMEEDPLALMDKKKIETVCRHDLCQRE